MEITSRNDEGRTVAQVNAEMSCGCPAGYQLRCETPEGDVVDAVDTCQISESTGNVADGFQFVGVREACSLGTEISANDAFAFMFCELP